MTASTYTQSLLNRLREMLPLTEDEIIQCGITEAATARIIELRQRTAQLTSHYGNQENLEKRISEEGVAVNDHTLYTDLLEWCAIKYELAMLTSFLENT